MSLRQLIKTIDQKEKKLILIIIVFIVLITSLPYFITWLSTPEEMIYSGLSIVNFEDWPVYFSYIDQVKDGKVLMENLFTTELQPIKQFSLFWLGVGIFAKVFHLPAFLALQLTRIILIPICLFITYLFIAYIFRDKVKRKISYLFLCFSSGVGAYTTYFFKKPNLALSIVNYPIDIWDPETNTFFTLFHSPHLIFSLILILLIFLFFLIALEEKRIKYAIWSGVFSLILFQFHPYRLPVILGVIFTYLFVKIIRNKKIIRYNITYFLILILISLPSILYHFYIFWNDPLALQGAIQNICITPPLLLIILGYGFLSVFVLWGIYLVFKDKLLNDKFLFIICWLVFQSVLIYFPITFQRRFIAGLHIPIVILSSFSLYVIYQFLNSKGYLKNLNPSLFVYLFCVLFFTSNLYILMADTSLFSANLSVAYISKNKMESFKWLKNRVEENEIILASFQNGNLLPGYSTRKVYLGHWSGTAYIAQKFQQVVWFLKNNKDDNLKKRFLAENNIQYLFYEEEAANLFRPEEKNYLRLVFQNKEVSIYKSNFQK